jgi:hypothetical protein
MKSHHLSWLIAFTLTLLVGSCAGRGPGPVAWIDRPLDNSHHPLAPVEWMVHASSNSGVSSFVFYLDGQELQRMDVTGERFELAETSWEPSQPGVYTLEVRAIDSGGVMGDPASSLVYIGDVGLEPRSFSETTYGQCEGVEFMRLELGSPVVPAGACSEVHWETGIPVDWPLTLSGESVERTGETVICANATTPIRLVVNTPNGECLVWQVLLVDEDLALEEQPPYEDIGIEFMAVPNQIQRGECSVLGWAVIGPEGLSVALDGNPVDYGGEMRVCPEGTTTYLLMVEGIGEPREVVQTVEVLEGDAQEPVETAYLEIPDEEATATPGASSPPPSTSPPPTSAPTSAPPDTTGPTISGASVNTFFVYTTGSGCSPTTFKFRVSVSDPSGVASVKLNWNGSGVRSGPVTMNYSGGKYAYDLGLFNNTGDLSNFSITATDARGNTSKINPGWNLSVEQCGGG